MGDVDPKVAASIKRTQELLGKHVKKPPLSEKNLARPPFRYLHDIVTCVINSTGFMKGVYSADELDSAKISSREAKSEFMQKLIKAIKDATGEEVKAKVSKILAGQEADKTNELLQALARAIEKSGGGGAAPAVAAKGNKATEAKQRGKDQKPVPGAAKDKKPVGKAAAPTKTETSSTRAKPSNAAPAAKGKPDEKPKRGVRDASPANKAAGGDAKESDARTRAGKTTTSKPSALPDPETKPEVTEQNASEYTTEKEVDEPTIEAKKVTLLGEPTDETGGSRKNTASSSSSRGSALIRRQNSSKTLGNDTNIPGQSDDTRSKSAVGDSPIQGKSTGDTEEIEVVHDVVDEEHLTLYNDFKNSAIKPNMETLPLPTSPILSDASVVKFGIPESPEIVDHPPTPVSMNKSARHRSPAEPKFGVANTPGPSGIGLSKIDEVESQDDFGHIASPGDNGRGGTSHAKNRPGTGNSRLVSARPPSARPAPPRPRSSMFKETEESNYRPPTGKVMNVLLDTSETADDEDDNFIVREASVSKGPGLSDLDETPELALTSGAKGDENIDDILPPEQRGFLVNQILETQKELEKKDNKDTAKQENFSVDRSKTREVTTAEIEKLKSMIQDCARNANPVGKLLDYVREDMDAMQKELTKWREESRQLDNQLESAKKATEASLQPLQQQLIEVEAQIQDKEDAIAATKMTILRYQERIEKILSGLDRVQSSHGKIVIPSATQLMQFEPTPASMLIQERDQEETEFSSGFGSALNRFSRTSTAMRPNTSNLFNSSEADLDPDNFDPWKE